MQFFKKSLSKFCFVSVLTLLVTATIYSQPIKTITAGSAGAIKIGMTVAVARKAMPKLSFVRTSDGEGVALIAVKDGQKVLFTMYAGEDDVDKPIDSKAVIEFIEVWSAAYKTAAGVNPGMLVSEVENRYGKLKEITISEIEAREYGRFARQPQKIRLRLQNDKGMAGVYSDGGRKTGKFTPGTKIASIIIMGDGNETNVGFYSDYTDLEKECKTPEGQGKEGGHVSTYCKAFGDFRIHIYDTAMTMEITVESTVSRKNTSVMRESLSFSTKGKKMEWRFKNGIPFAVIMRGRTYAKDKNGQMKYPENVTGEYLFVRGLPGFERIKSDVNLRTTKFANKEARIIADTGFAAENPRDPYKMLDTTEYNKMIENAVKAGESWVRSPMGVAMRIVGPFEEMKTRDIKFEAASSEANNAVTLTVVNEGLLDDSVRGEKFVYELRKSTSGVWKVTAANKAWRCWPDRGHDNYSTVPCV
jgi:hypothetical protein